MKTYLNLAIGAAARLSNLRAHALREQQKNLSPRHWKQSRTTLDRIR